MVKEKIMVVEDNRPVAEFIQDTLRSSGYGVSDIVSSGEEAVKKAEQLSPDLVLMDIILEGKMDGIEASKQIRDRFNIPVIYLTGHAEENLLQRAKITEPFGYILKPFEGKELHTTIKMAIYKHKKDNELKKRMLELQDSRTAMLNVLEDVTEAREALEKSDRLKNVFIGMMSHELRTPLNVILGYVDILSTDLRSLVNEERREMFDAIVRGGERLKKLVDDIMDISQIEADQMKLYMQPIEADDLVKNCVNEIVIPARNKSLDIIEKYHGDKTHIKVDRLRFPQALGNILQNAVKYTNKGSINITTEVENNIYTITVKDTGKGIKKDFLPFIFALFRQEDEGYKRKYEGAGLGLYVSQRLFTSMGGKIDVDSDEGRGTEFVLSFPASTEKVLIVEEEKPELPDVKRHEEVKKEVERKQTVLVLEDNPANVDYIQFLLRKLQVDYVTAASGKDALECLEENSVDGMLIDISLATGMSGVEFLERVKTQDRFKNIPKIAVTAHAMKGQREEFIKTGFDDYLPKPFKLKDLRELLARTLKGYS
ncbi:MAG: response regulator [bacterium]